MSRIPTTPAEAFLIAKALVTELAGNCSSAAVLEHALGVMADQVTKRQALADYMIECSEDACSGTPWHTGWEDGLEFALWQLVEDPTDNPALFDDDVAPKLAELSEQCHGWVVWRDKDTGPTWVNHAEWTQIYRAFKGR